MARPYKRKGSRFWWIAPWIEGRQVPQSSGETDYDLAERKLRILEGKIAGGAPIKARTDRDCFENMLRAVETDYAVKQRRSSKDLKRRIDKHLIPRLGHLPAGKVAPAIPDYILERRKDERPASNASINRELAIIRRAFTLGMRSGAVSSSPFIEDLPEDNIRQGFFVEDHFRSVLAKANDLLADVLTVAYYTGWRIESILEMEWSYVSFKEQVIRLPANRTKNRKETTFPLEPFPELKTALERRLKKTKEAERRGERIIPHVFHRDGGRVKSIRKAWELTRVRAGVPGRLIHDMRRTAVKNLIRQGWSETQIMNMVGFKTRAMFLRYAIITEEDILSRAKAIAALQKM